MLIDQLWNWSINGFRFHHPPSKTFLNHRKVWKFIIETSKIIITLKVLAWVNFLLFSFSNAVKSRCLSWFFCFVEKRFIHELFCGKKKRKKKRTINRHMDTGWITHLNSSLQARRNVRFWLESSTLFYSQCQRNKTQTGQEIDPHILHVLDDEVSRCFAANRWDTHTHTHWPQADGISLLNPTVAPHFNTAVNTLLFFKLLCVSSFDHI